MILLFEVKELKLIEVLRGHPGEETKKTVRIRMAIVVVLALVGIFFLWRGVSGWLNKVPGWVNVEQDRIELENGEKIYAYYGDIQVNMYYKDRSSQSANSSAIKTIVDDTLMSTHKLTDTTTSYTGINNLKYINEHPGEEIVLNEYLYNALKESYQYSVDTSGLYNVFAGETYDTWWQFMYGNAISYDEVLAKVEEINVCANKQLQATDALVFNDAKKSIIFNNLDGCEDKISLNLQGLRYSYAAEALKEALQAGNYTFGYIYSADGISLTLGDQPQSTTWTSNILDPGYSSDVDISALASTYLDGSFNCYSFDNMHLVNSVVTKDYVAHLLYSSLETEPGNQFHTIMIWSKTTRLQDLIIETMKVLYSDSISEGSAELASYTNSDIYGALVYSNEADKIATKDLTIAISKEAEEYTTVNYIDVQKVILD